jgi:acyl-CoA thioesterase I
MPRPASWKRRTALLAAGPALLATHCAPAKPAASNTSPATTVPPTPTPAVKAPLTYVALGASDAAGVGVEDPHRDAWVSVLARTLPQPARLVNLGIPGVRLFEAIEVELPPALEAQPDLVTIWLVVNDILANVTLDAYTADLDRLLLALRNGTTARVAIGNVPNAPDSLQYLGMGPAQRRAVAEQWNGAIAATAKKHGAVLVDLYNRWPLTQHPEYIGPDRLHPTVAGYRTLAETFYQVLREEHVV